MNNPGAEPATYGSLGFIAIDDSGIAHDPELFVDIDCNLDYEVNVFPSGTLDGCIVFEVPDTGKLTVYYAPFQIDQFSRERSLKWEITY
jgi:hypothetical protein